MLCYISLFYYMPQLLCLNKVLSWNWIMILQGSPWRTIWYSGFNTQHDDIYPHNNLLYFCIPSINHVFFWSNFLWTDPKFDLLLVHGDGSLHCASSFYWPKIYQPAPYSLQQKVPKIKRSETDTISYQAK